MRNKYAAFLICAQILSPLSAYADTLPDSKTSQKGETPESELMIVKFSGTGNGHIEGGLQIIYPEQLESLVSWLKDNPDSICYLDGHVNSPLNSEHSEPTFDEKLSEARVEALTAALTRNGIDVTRFVKRPRAGIDYYKPGLDGDYDKNISVSVECPPLAWAPLTPLRKLALSSNRASL